MSSDKDIYSRNVDRRMMERNFFNDYEAPSSPKVQPDKIGEINNALKKADL